MATATATTTPGAAAGSATGGRSVVAAAGTPAATAGTVPVVTGPVAVLRSRAGAFVARPEVRRALPVVVTGLVLALFAIAWLWMQSSPHRPVMPGLAEADRQAAFEALRTADFDPRIDTATGQLTVPGNRYHEARIFLASQGLPKGGPVGLDALKDQSSMTTSQFMEQVRVNAAMEQELARSIMQIATVQSARVHLATPRQSVFVRDRTPPKASVVVAPHPGRVVSPSQVQAIVHLVSSSVPYLAPEHVTVVDSVGQLMTESAAELRLGLTAAQTQHKQHLEELYRTRIQQILAPIVGEQNVRTQVNLVLDFTQIESTTEDFDTRDKGPKTRSEVLSQDRNARREASGIPGALSNTAPPDPTTTTNTAVDPTKGQSESSDTVSSRSTRNFELDRSVRHVKSASGTIQRLSVAVVVNGRESPPPAAPVDAKADAKGDVKGDAKGDAKADAKADPGAAAKDAAAGGYSPQELQRLQELVRGVVGFDATRGDVVTVVQARFEAPLGLEPIPWYLEDRVHAGVRTALLGLGFIVFLLVVVRPLMRNLTASAVLVEGEAAGAPARLPDGELSDEDMRMIQIGEGESLEEIKAKLKPKKSSISIDMLDTANTYDDKVALIRMLVAEDSGRVANVLKGMIRVG